MIGWCVLMLLLVINRNIVCNAIPEMEEVRISGSDSRLMDSVQNPGSDSGWETVQTAATTQGSGRLSRQRFRVLEESSSYSEHEQEPEAGPPLESPVPSRPSHTNHSLVAALVVLMVLATAALVCCCYLWEHQLRLRMENSNHDAGHGPTALQQPARELGGGRDSNLRSTNLRMVSTPSAVIVLIGDDNPRPQAWALPQRIPAAQFASPNTTMPFQDANRSTVQPDGTTQSLGKLAPSL